MCKGNGHEPCIVLVMNTSADSKAEYYLSPQQWQKLLKENIIMLAFLTMRSAADIREKVGCDFYLSPTKKAQVRIVNHEVVLMFQVRKPEYNQEWKVNLPMGIFVDLLRIKENVNNCLPQLK